MGKRSTVRNRTLISVACSSLAGQSPDAVSYGYMVNCSGWGACEMLNHKMQAGSIVMIKATDFALQNSPKGFRMFALAEVKWSKRLEGDIVSSYATGLRYLFN